MGGSTAVTNAFSVDVEDYFHVSAFASTIRPENWERLESRVERNTERVLARLDEHGVKATFFVLGWIAQRHPALIQGIYRQGHEVACHGFSHQLVYRQSQATFREETLRAKGILEDIIQAPVLGYRAASYSITARSIWALDVLAEAGFRYDSSIFPVRHDLYGMPNAPRLPYRMETPSGHTLVEFPLTTKRMLGAQLPVAGGGYFRLYPYRLTKWALRSINRRESRPFIFYLHPWEVDPQQPRIVGAPWRSRFRHYNNLDRCEARLVRLLGDFRFAPVREVLRNLGLWDAQQV